MSEQQLDLIKKSNRGGARKGAGRKAERLTGTYGQKSSKVIRVSKNYVDVVKQLLAMLDAASDMNEKNIEVFETMINADKADLLNTDGAIKIQLKVERYIPD